MRQKCIEELIRKIVDERIAEHNKDDYEQMIQMQKALGWENWITIFGMRGSGLTSPMISVHERIEALYKYFKLDARRKQEQSTVIAVKIKKEKK